MSILIKNHKIELIKETIERYNEIAEQYAIDWRGKNDKTGLRHLHRFRDRVGLPPKRILDAGCGTGKSTLYFASNDYDVYGIDLSSGMLDKAAETLRNENLEAKLLNGDMRSLNFSENYFDGIWCVASLVHLISKDKIKAIKEFYRILKPEGIIYIGVPNLLSFKHMKRLVQSQILYLNYNNSDIILSLKPLKKIFSFDDLIDKIKFGYAYLDYRHWFYPTKHSLLKMLRNEGFSILESNNMFSKRLSIYAKKMKDIRENV